MSPDLESRIARIEERTGTLKESHAELKGILAEMREENKDLPRTISREIRKAIRKCRGNPPKTESSKKPDTGMWATWNKAIVTGLVLLLSAAAAWFQNANAGGTKDASNKPTTSQSQEK